MRLFSVPGLVVCLMAAGSAMLHGQEGAGLPEKQQAARRQEVKDSSLVVVKLDEAVVTAKVESVKVVEDTVEYNAAAYRLPEDAVLEDLLSKIPGLEINGGTVTLHGKEIKQLLIDGKRFFGGNVKTGLQNLPADMVAKVRAFEQESEFTRQTGIDDGEKESVLDLKIKKNMLDGWRGNVTGGYGGPDNRYIGRMSANKITKKSHDNVILNFNDLNWKQTLDNEDRKTMGSGSKGDSHRREIGYSLSRSGKGLEADANVHYDGSSRNAVGDGLSQTVYADGTTAFKYISNAQYQDDTPSLGGRVEWKPRKDLSFLFKLDFKLKFRQSLQNTDGDRSNMEGAWSSRSDNWSKKDMTDADGSFIFQVTKRFSSKKGRNLSFYSNSRIDCNGDDNPLTYKTVYSTKTSIRKEFVRSDNLSCNLQNQVSWNEPLGKRFHLQAVAGLQCNLKSSERNVYDIYQADTSWTVQQPLPENYRDYRMDNISSSGRYTQYVPKLNILLRYVKKKFNLSAGVSLTPQWTVLQYRDSLGLVDASRPEKTVTKFIFNAAPNISLSYRPTFCEKLSFTYRSWPGSTSLYNLIPVGSGTNPLYIHYGNEDLLPTFTHKMQLEYNFSNLRRQSSLVCSANAKIVQNSVVNRSTYNPTTGGTVTIPVNLDPSDGIYWDARASVVYDKSFNRNFSLTQKAVTSYVNSVSYLYQSRITEANTMGRFIVTEHLSGTYRNDWMELTLKATADWSSEKSDLRPEINQQPWSAGGGASANFTLPWEMRLKAEYSFLAQRGYAFGDLNRNYNLLGASVSQPFARKKLILSLEGYDLLRQLPNLTRSVSPSFRSTVSYNGVNSYIILRLVYRFKIL